MSVLTFSSMCGLGSSTCLLVTLIKSSFLSGISLVLWLPAFSPNNIHFSLLFLPGMKFSTSFTCLLCCWFNMVELTSSRLFPPFMVLSTSKSSSLGSFSSCLTCLTLSNLWVQSLKPSSSSSAPEPLGFSSLSKLHKQNLGVHCHIQACISYSCNYIYM